jgi:hypothetical protein
VELFFVVCSFAFWKGKKKKELFAPNVLRVLYETWPADTRGHFAGRLVCEEVGARSGERSLLMYIRGNIARMTCSKNLLSVVTFLASQVRVRIL